MHVHKKCLTQVFSTSNAFHIHTETYNKSFQREDDERGHRSTWQLCPLGPNQDFVLGRLGASQRPPDPYLFYAYTSFPFGLRT